MSEDPEIMFVAHICKSRVWFYGMESFIINFSSLLSWR